MKYVRMPIEAESPEQFGYDKIKHNLAESSVTDRVLGNLNLDLSKLVLCYGHHAGHEEFRKLLAHEYVVHPQDVLLTAGAAAALFIVATSLLDKEDHLIVVHPNYATNIETPKAIGCQISYAELRFENGFKPDIAQIEAMIKPNTRYISITTPHNPTGTLLSEEELEQLIAIAEKHGIYLLVDETYRDMNFTDLLPLAATYSKQVISVSSLSKTYGLPGIRIGWIITENKKLQELFLAAKEQIYICNSVVDEEIAFQYFKHKKEYIPAIQNHIEENLWVMRSFMDQQPFLEWVEPAGGAVCFLRFKSECPIDIEKFYNILNNKYHTWVGPGHWFGMDKRYMRIGYGWPDKMQLTWGLNYIRASAEEALLAV